MNQQQRDRNTGENMKDPSGSNVRQKSATQDELNPLSD